MTTNIINGAAIETVMATATDIAATD
jgi:hypothetical protein